MWTQELDVSTYLAGPINVGKMKECKDWRLMVTEYIKQNYDIKSLNPLGDKGGDRIGPDLRQKLYNANKLGDIDTIRRIVRDIIIPPDLIMVEQCTFLTLWIPEKDGYEICGSFGEVTLAHYLNIPVYIVTERKIYPCELPNWVIGCSTEIFTSWDDYFKFIGDKYGSKRPSYRKT